jgi:putative Holliday junction resolvase
MPELAKRQPGTILAFDFGEKRVGVAVGERQLAQAHALTTIRSEVNNTRFAAIAALIDEWQPVSLVVGLPLALDGSAHAMTARCRRFANQLRGRFGLPVEYAEERLTSVEAEEKLRASGHNARSLREHLDALAAQIILQCYFERTAEATCRRVPDCNSVDSTEPQAHAAHQAP